MPHTVYSQGTPNPLESRVIKYPATYSLGPKKNVILEKILGQIIKEVK
jgi:hypothetical protein